MIALILIFPIVAYASQCANNNGFCINSNRECPIGYTSIPNFMPGLIKDCYTGDCFRPYTCNYKSQKCCVVDFDYKSAIDFTTYPVSAGPFLINTFDGSLSYTQTDMQINGMFPIDISINFNTLLFDAGLDKNIGRGWRLNYNIYYEKEPNEIKKQF